MVVADSLPDHAPLKPVRGEVAAPAFPAVLKQAGSAACFAADEFFSARISNAETRRAYSRAVIHSSGIVRLPDTLRTRLDLRHRFPNTGIT